MVNVLVYRLRKRAVRGSCNWALGDDKNLDARCESMWYLGSLGEFEKSLRITGASAARAGSNASAVLVFSIARQLTLASNASSVDTCTAHHDVVDYGENDFAAHPMPLFV